MNKHDLADAVAIFLALGGLIFGFPWLMAWLCHIADKF